MARKPIEIIECPDCMTMYSPDEYSECPQCREIKDLYDDIFGDEDTNIPSDKYNK